MITRDDFVKKVKKQLDDLNAGIAKIEHRSQHVREEVKEKLQARIKFLYEKRDFAIAKVQEVKLTSEEGWYKLKLGTESVVSSLNDALNKTLSHFKKRETPLNTGKVTE